MSRFKTSLPIVPVLAMAVFPIAACSSGGGGSGSPTAGPATSQAIATATPAPAPTFCAGCVGPVTNGFNSDTGIAAGPIAAPVPASFGSAPAQFAVPGGASFDGKSGSYPANAIFPLLSTTLKPASPGMSATTAQDATLTVIGSSANSQNLQLTIPSLNLNVNVNFGENIVNNIDGFTFGTSYVAAGEWDQRPGSGGPVQSSTAFVLGYQTPASAMPTTGTANFSGLASGTVFTQGSGTIIETQVNGSGALSADFSSGKVTGFLVGMSQWDGVKSNLPWNNVSFDANIAPGSNRFNGTAAATSAPGTAFSLSAAATGNINGAFYGPAAQNAGAIWSLSDGSKSAIGSLTLTGH